MSREEEAEANETYDAEKGSIDKELHPYSFHSDILFGAIRQFEAIIDVISNLIHLLLNA